MSTITVQVSHSNGATGYVTLSERLTTTHLHDDYYVAQLLERLTWAIADAEALEAQRSGQAHGRSSARRRRIPAHKTGTPA
jgi:hypothetical protein